MIFLNLEYEVIQSEAKINPVIIKYTKNEYIKTCVSIHRKA